MRSDIYWVSEVPRGRIAIMARPRGDDWLEDEVRGWRRAGVQCVVSLLTRPEEKELGIEAERKLCQANGIEFLSFPIPDRSTPTSYSAATRIISELQSRLASGKAVAIHCRAGIGRSSMIAAATLAGLSISVSDAFARIEKARGLSVPDTPEQRQWVEQFADQER